MSDEILKMIFQNIIHEHLKAIEWSLKANLISFSVDSQDIQ